MSISAREKDPAYELNLRGPIFLGGLPETFFHELVDQEGRVQSVELAGPHIACRVSLSALEGLTVSFLSPCCRRELVWNANNPIPTSCSYCARTPKDKIIEVWWERSSQSSLPDRLESYLLAWGLQPLSAVIEASLTATVIKDLSARLS